jgi:hypothetical protein
VANIFVALLLILFSVPAVFGEGISDGRQPVLVELFTSEGCSSCPPADALLARLDEIQPIAGAQLIVLSEHVDYWNRLGWVDPYSSPLFSARQSLYAKRLRTQGPYTPQMVVDGRFEFVGSDMHGAESAVRDALRERRVAVRVVDEKAYATVEVPPLPAGRAQVYAAYAADSGVQDVSRGENKGRHLRHVAIVAELKQLGSTSSRSGFTGRVPLRSGTRLVIFVQAPDGGPVWGSAMLSSRSAEPQ